MVLYIGNHTSSSKGYAAMGRQMVKNGGNTFAFFTRNPRGGKAKEIDPADVEKFLELAREHHFGKIVAHAPYTMNACAAKENLRDFAREIMADDLKRMEYTPGNYYNFHPGSHVGQGIEAGIAKIAEILNDVLTEEQSTTVLLETMSGKVHLNDSMNRLGSHKHRHAKIGEGEIGLDALVEVVCHPALKGVPFILETPNDDEGWKREITLLRERYAMKGD